MDRTRRDHLYSQILKLLQDLSDLTDELPSNYFITGVSKPGYIESGGEADILKGVHKGADVAARAVDMKTTGSDKEKCIARKVRELVEMVCSISHNIALMNQIIRREILAHRQLNHPNILWFIGVSREHDDYPLLIISPWIRHGIASKYLKNCPTEFITIVSAATIMVPALS